MARRSVGVRPGPTRPACSTSFLQVDRPEEQRGARRPLKGARANRQVADEGEAGAWCLRVDDLEVPALIRRRSASFEEQLDVAADGT